MYEDKVNVYINSKNRATNETVSNFNIAIPDGLLRLYDKNEYWTLNVNFFSCFNSWYNCMNNFNDEFELIYHNNSGVQTEVINCKSNWVTESILHTHLILFKVYSSKYSKTS